MGVSDPAKRTSPASYFFLDQEKEKGLTTMGSAGVTLRGEPEVMFLHLSINHSVLGGCLPQCMREQTLSQEQTPPRSRHPPGTDTPREADTPSAQCMPGDMGNKQTVSILMECIHVIGGSQLSSGAEYVCPFLCPFVFFHFHVVFRKNSPE